ncbi:MAG: class I SAM-dependent methyltransferase [Candidatus Latescibacteria bacterium]|nr:class I SAM-dependent methyltransferase [Candidatus Latescibacterota bacterium]
MPSERDQVKDYFERCADRFDGFYKEGHGSLFQRLAHVVFRKPGLVRRFQATVDILGDVRGKTLLDVGCGSGIYAIYFARKGAEVTGIDFSEPMLSLARKNAGDENCKIDLIKDDFLKRPLEARFDHALFIGVFDYVKKNDLLSYFEKALQVTDQKIIATFPKRYTVLQTPIRYFWLKRQNCPVYFYTRRQIRALARQADLSLKFHNCGPIWTVEFIRKQGRV